jgi:DNA-binding transcriptional regulator YiaG
LAIEVKADGNLSAEDIKNLRLSLGWSQECFARELGATLNSVYKWESGKSNPLPVFQQKLRELQKKAQNEVK